MARANRQIDDVEIADPYDKSDRAQHGDAVRIRPHDTATIAKCIHGCGWAVHKVQYYDVLPSDRICSVCGRSH